MKPVAILIPAAMVASGNKSGKPSWPLNRPASAVALRLTPSTMLSPCRRQAPTEGRSRASVVRVTTWSTRRSPEEGGVPPCKFETETGEASCVREGEQTFWGLPR